MPVPIVSMVGIALIIVVITAAGRDSLLSIEGLLILIVLVQNGGLASAIANSVGKIAIMGLAPAVFGPLMKITGSILASYWHKRTPKGYGEDE